MEQSQTDLQVRQKGTFGVSNGGTEPFVPLISRVCLQHNIYTYNSGFVHVRVSVLMRGRCASGSGSSSLMGGDK